MLAGSLIFFTTAVYGLVAPDPSPAPDAQLVAEILERQLGASLPGLGGTLGASSICGNVGPISGCVGPSGVSGTLPGLGGSAGVGGVSGTLVGVGGGTAAAGSTTVGVGSSTTTIQGASTVVLTAHGSRITYFIVSAATASAGKGSAGAATASTTGNSATGAAMATGGAAAVRYDALGGMIMALAVGGAVAAL